MPNKKIDIDFGNLKVSVKLEEEGVVVDILKKMDGQIGFCRTDELIKSTSETYGDLGVEMKEVIAHE
tara:strand:+ start:814 stop:1014 length:201 start_codon:yes stop_codon:yes gene_type:complete